MIDQIRKKIIESDPFLEFEKKIRSLRPDKPIHICGISGSLLSFVAAHLYDLQLKQLLVVVPDKDKAEQLRDDCALLLGESVVQLYACGPSHAAKLLDMSAPIAQIETLRALSKMESALIIASAEAITVSLPPKENFIERSIELDVNKEYPFEELIQKLISLGFEKKDFVEEYGDFAVRGGILDVFPFIGDNPIRFEFWGDTIESIREFDTLSQRSIRELQSANITASLRCDYANNADSPQNADFTDGVKSQKSEINGRKLSKQYVTIFEYLNNDATVLLYDPILIQREIEELIHEGHEETLRWNEIEKKINNFSVVEHSALVKHENAIDFRSQSQPAIGGSIKRLIEQVRNLNEDGYEVFISCDTKEEGERLNELIEEELTAPEKQNTEYRIENIENTNQDNENNYIAKQVDINSIASAIQYSLFFDALHSGFVNHPAKIATFTEHEIFGRVKRRGSTKRKKFKGFSQKEFQLLKRGDFVVHQDYGIGKFSGLQKIKVRGVETEVMKILYEENDSLYVHLNYINRVQKYSSKEGHTPKLSKLGGTEWERLKSRARKKIKDIARDLIKLYARRKHEKGFAFAPDTHWQKEMEASFIYEDTPDQASSTIDIKKDMEAQSPMDRLICGDVGFGKTEVAVRATFKAIMNGKQVAVLVPTTILAQQHFNTFLDRIGRYSVRIESMTRFRTRKEQLEILQALQEGKVDVIIGTHRLLSKDVIFKDLGLLIIDEEQRFGVAAKEKLRQLRANVDTLTLTATPIPRTLQFSLMGARDLSLINTPPRNRIPIQTEIAQFDMQLIREAILKELHRVGQVYFVHDRVQNIDLIQSMLEEHIPQARFHVAHGQMKGHELEKAMLDFMEKKYDVLICTKIIESGIDIPSVNTIIINRADRFGLAELYQLRGRVGRSNVQAYAYLLTPPLSVLPRVTLRRMQAIQEFTELGSGFNLAMRDLEIRGAGNLLGGEQSGFILEMGFEMYQRIVEEAVAELKEEEFQEIRDSKIIDKRIKKPEIQIETDIEALIPDIYVEQDSERLDIYRRLYKCESAEDINAMRIELQDRFGEYPEEVENLFKIVELKLLTGNSGFIKLELSGESLNLHFPSPDEKMFYEGDNAPFQKIVSQIQTLKKFNPHLKQDNKQLKLVARIKSNNDANKKIDEIKKFIENLLQQI